MYIPWSRQIQKGCEIICKCRSAKKKTLGENALYSECITTACVYNICWNRTCGTSPHYLIYLSFAEFIFLVVFFFIMDTNRCMRSGLIWIMCYLLFGRYNLLGLKGSKKWWWILYVYVWLSGWTVHFQITCIFGLNLILDINHFAMHWL